MDFKHPTRLTPPKIGDTNMASWWFNQPIWKYDFVKLECISLRQNRRQKFHPNLRKKNATEMLEIRGTGMPLMMCCAKHSSKLCRLPRYRLPAEPMLQTWRDSGLMDLMIPNYSPENWHKTWKSTYLRRKIIWTKPSCLSSMNKFSGV